MVRLPLWACGWSGAAPGAEVLPAPPLAEDRALEAALRARDLKVRHALDVRVRTSVRDAGRAPGTAGDGAAFERP